MAVRVSLSLRRAGRVAGLAALALTGCYQSHEGSAAGPMAMDEPDPDAIVDTTHPGPDGLPVRCFEPDALTLALGPERGCASIDVPGGGAGASCSSFLGESHGTPVRIARRAVGRVDIRATLLCDGPCGDRFVKVLPLSPDTCWGCLPAELAPSSGGLSARVSFAHHQVDGLLEAIVAGETDETVRIEACFDPDYGPPPWPTDGRP